ncbi:MAG: chemotaxis response regulator protein-glutamate methylesterase [Actinobacteria bacterium HGW-Actinobacteria-10]|jgi:two-component system chemotaxis response regulator CheB|nr:MAG: chemotaxis response regulator protein-glutamate methylesterase [Actinobacteria bacterium HGW-Actinobacteria-10]
MRTTIKVLIVDDSALIRQMLTRALSVDPRIEVVGTAKTGVEAIEQTRLLQPDIITLDIEMPELTGLEALPHLRKLSDARILMLTTLDDPDTTLQALSGGAVDFIAKPREGFASSLLALTDVLLKKIRIAYRVSPDSLDRAKAGAQITALAAHSPEGLSDGGHEAEEPDGERASEIHNIVGIAASTGGPPALERVLAGLNSRLPATYLLVQHLPAGFSTSLARRLSKSSGVPVHEAVDGMILEPARAYLAPHGLHMVLTEPSPGIYRIRLDDTPPMHGVRPSADPLFQSLAELLGDRAVGVVLTGMGADGADGMASIKSVGGETIAQDEATSVVWGMPGAAHKIGAVRRMVPIDNVAIEIRRVIRGGSAS